MTYKVLIVTQYVSASNVALHSVVTEFETSKEAILAADLINQDCRSISGPTSTATLLFTSPCKHEFDNKVVQLELRPEFSHMESTMVPNSKPEVQSICIHCGDQQ